MKFLAYLLIIIGIFCYGLAGYYFWLRQDSSRLAFNTYQAPTTVSEEKTKRTPTRVIITDLKINTPLVPAALHNNQWETTDKGASYLTSSPLPGENGNSIIYGHNWPVLFGNLIKAKPGQEVVVEYSDKSRKTFTIAYTATVTPSDASILAKSDDKRITLYTCSGWFDDKRFVAVAIAS